MSGGSPQPATNCPSGEAIECLAHGDAVPESVQVHVASCADCAARLRQARSEAEFVGRARTLLEPDLGPIGAPRLTGYRFLGVIGTGGQGVVYRALQESTSRTVAVKVLMAGEGTASDPLRPAGEGSRAIARRRLRAEREVEVIARLRHPSIVSVYESRALESGRVALVMEYVDGPPIDRWLETIPAAQRLEALLAAFAEVCAGVHHAHLNGVVHRDLKPDNVLVTTAADGGVRPVVLDFGIAKLRHGAAALVTTAAGEFAGTPAYASPEQVAGRPEGIDALTDVYSLGVILYRLACGRLPYELGESIFEAARIIGSVEPAPPRSVSPAVSRDLEAVMLRALRKDKALRYQSAAALGNDIQRLLAGEPVEARSESGWYLLRKAVMVNRKRLAVASTVAATLIAAGTTIVISVRRASDSAAAAEVQRARARTEQVRARAVTELLRDTLPDTDPNRPEITRVIGRGLGKLYYRLETGAFADDPEVDQEVRRLWGSMYTSFRGKAANQVEYAEISLRNGLVRLRQQHGGDHPDIAASAQQLAGLLLVRNRFLEAASVCQDVIQMRERLDGGGPSIDLAEAYGLLARISAATGKRSDAANHARHTLSVLKASPGSESLDGGLLRASMLRLLAAGAMETGDHAAAEPMVRDALRELLSAVPADDPDVIEALSLAGKLADAAPALSLAAELRRCWPNAASLAADLPLLARPSRGGDETVTVSGRTDAIKRLVEFQSGLIGKNHRALVGTLLMLAESAMVEVRMSERADAGLRAAAVLRANNADPFAWLLCMQDASMGLMFAGESQKAVLIATECCAQWERVPPPVGDALVIGNARRYLAWHCLLDGQYGQAVRHARTAQSQLKPVVDDAHHVVAICRAIESQALAEIGQLAEADELSARALADAIASPAISPDQASLVRAARAHVLLAQNREPALAAALLEKAWSDYYFGVPLSTPSRRMVLQGLMTAAERSGDAAALQRWRAERERPPSAEPTRINR